MTPKTFKAPTAKQVLSQISRELGPDALIVAHRKTRDSEGKLRFEATASARAEGVPSKSISLPSEKPWAGFSRKKFFIPALGLIVLITAGVVIWQLVLQKESKNPFPQKLSVAVVSFENQTGSDSYDYLNNVIPNLLITSLEQSGHFSVTSWERLHDLLRQTGKEEVEVIDRDLGFELCQMDEIDTIVIGSYTKSGDMFVTDVKVLDVETKKILKSANSRGNGEESIIQSQIDDLCREISQGVGTAEHEGEGIPMRIAEVTTDSLGAYYYFLRGIECYDDMNNKDAITFLKKAVEIDSDFATAHLYLANSLLMTNQGKAAKEAYKKAKSLSARATEKERLYIDCLYARNVERDFEESFRISTKLVKLYPKEKDFRYQLAMIYFRKDLYNQAIEEFNKILELDPYNVKTLNAIAWSYQRLRNYEKAIEYFEKQSSVSPGNALPIRLMASIYFEMGRLDESLKKYKEAFEVNPEDGFDWRASYILALKENYTEAIESIDLTISKPSYISKGFFYLVKSFYKYWLGRLDESISDLQGLVDYAETIGSKRCKAQAYWMMGWISLDKGKFELCRKQFKKWFDIYEQDVLPTAETVLRKIPWTAWYDFYLGLIDIKQGKVDSARSRLADMNAHMADVAPGYINWVSFYHDFLQAEIFLAEGAVEQAITVGEKSTPLGELVVPTLELLYNVPFQKDVLARAYRQNGEIDKAIAEYERLVVFDPERKERCLIHPKYYYRLAELYEQKGVKRKAVMHYEKFLDLWKDADSDIP